MRRLGGVDGNERLTDELALVLLILLVLEAATTLDLSAYLAVHIFLGLVLLPAVVFTCSRHQKPMRANEHKPTPSQPTNMSKRLSPRTSVSIANVKRFRYAKKRQ